MTKFVAALANTADVVPGDHCDVSVIKSEIVNYHEDHAGNEIPEYGLTDELAMDAIETTIRADGDIHEAMDAADRILRNAGWTRTGDWEAAQNAYYADVERA